MPSNDFLERINIPYILELYINDGQPYYMSMPNIPSSLEIVELPPISIRHTYGEYPIREHNVGTNFRISLKGHVTSAKRLFWGNRAKTPNSIGAPLQADTKGPVEIVKEFNDFLREYQELAKERGTLYLQAGEGYKSAKQNLLLVFRDLVYDRHFYVEPSSINFRRNVQTSTCSAEFEFVFTGYKDAGRSVPKLGGPNTGMKDAKFAFIVPAAAFAPQPAQSSTFINTFSSQGDTSVVASYALTGTPLDRVFNVCTRLENYIDKAQAAVGTGQRYFDVLRGPGRRLLQVSSKMRQLEYAIGDLVDAPRRLISDYVQAAEIFLASIIGIRQAISQVFSPETYLAGFDVPFLLEKLAQDAYADAVTLAGAVGLNTRRLSYRTAGAQSQDPLIQAPEGPGANSLLLEQPTQGFQVYEMKAGETWLDVATSFGIPWLGWQAIAAFNQAFVPELKGDGSPLQAGDLVRVPLASPTAQTVVNQASAPDALAAVYGTDLYLNPDTGDWDLATKSGGVNTGGAWTIEAQDDASDFATVSGLKNIDQVLRMRLTQAANSWKGHPTVGVEGLTIGSTPTSAAQVRTAASVRGQLAQDPRFTGSRNLQVLVQGNVTSIGVEVGIIGQDRLVNVVAPATGL